MAKRQFRSVTEMVRSISDSKETVNRVEKKIAARQIVVQLATLRMKQGLSQADVAEEMGCTQSRISKLENGVDQDLTIGDIETYLKVLHLEMNVVFHESSLTKLAFTLASR